MRALKHTQKSIGTESKSSTKGDAKADARPESKKESKHRVHVPGKGKVDPLFIIFEQHLFNFQDPDLDRKTFVERVVSEYLTFLRKLNISIPKSLEGSIVEELSGQIHTMLVKKIYGCFSIQEFQKGLTPNVKKQARARYSRLTK